MTRTRHRAQASERSERKPSEYSRTRGVCTHGHTRSWIFIFNCRRYAPLGPRIEIALPGERELSRNITMENYKPSTRPMIEQWLGFCTGIEISFHRRRNEVTRVSPLLFFRLTKRYSRATETKEIRGDAHVMQFKREWSEDDAEYLWKRISLENFTSFTLFGDWLSISLK